MTETPPTTPTAAHDDLALQVVALASERDKFKVERDEYKRLYLDMLALNRKLEIGVFGKGRERDLGDPNGTTMSMLGLMTGSVVTPAPAPVSEPEPEKTRVPAHERAKPTGRQTPPEHLPRIDIEVLPPEVQAKGTDAFEKIGEEVTETIERRRASLIVVRQHKGKYVEKGRDLAHAVTVLQAEPLDLPIPRGLAGPALLAETIVQRFADHLPLHRQERIYGREGVPLARSTICDWHLQLAKLVRRLVDAMWGDAFKAPYLCVDATGVLVQQIEKCRNAYFFVVAAPERHVLFGYSPKHNKAAVDALLAGYEGYLVADAHSVYDHLFASAKLLEVACWAHARRYFFKALGSDPLRARHALERIGKLFALERVLNGRTPEEKRVVRLRDDVPILDEFEAWCDREAMVVLDETPISRAIGYARNHRAALRRFLDDGRLPIHNNWSERELRREAVGRKNWLFLGSDDGGEVNALFVSLIASCQLHGLEPAAYLRDLFCLLPGWMAADVLDLAPMNWKRTLERDDVTQALATNVFRQVALGDLKPEDGEK